MAEKLPRMENALENKEIQLLTVEEEESSQCQVAPLRWVFKKESSLEGVEEWHPRQISEGQHVTKSVMGQVHGGQDSILQ